MKVTEKDVRDKIQEELKKDANCQKYIVKAKKLLLYKILMSEDGEFPSTEDLQNPDRKGYTFQIDDLIIEEAGDETKKIEIPLVALELKSYGKKSGISTHDIITYSSKALMHKEIYPNLRYGLLYIHPKDPIPQRFFIHNVGFDFAIVINDINVQDNISRLVDLLKEQIKVSQNLRDVQRERRRSTSDHHENNKIRVSSFSTIVKFDWGSNEDNV